MMGDIENRENTGDAIPQHDKNNIENTSVRTKCDICNIHDINDWENHEKSRRHQSKYRTKNKKPVSGDSPNYTKCIYCNREFTDQKFYTIHLGTKTHRRNQKRAIMRDAIETDTITPMVIRTSIKRGRRLGIPEDESLLEFTRKKYKIRNIKIDDITFRSYIYSVTAYLSMRLSLHHNVQDFMISVNDKNWEAFGDIVINVVYKDKDIIYAIQCKQVTQGSRQISSLEEAKLHLEKQYDHLDKLRNKGRDIHDIKFVVFTTCSTTPNFCKSVNISSEVLKKWKCNAEVSKDAIIEVKPLTKKNDIVNITNDPENVYSLLLKDEIECALPYISLYTSQRISPSLLNQLLKLRFDNYPDISKDYIKYIENWGEGKLGGNYKLRKKDVILRLGEILLSPYIISPKKIQSQHDRFDIWNSVIDKVDLTVVKNELFIISKICQPLNKLIEDTLGTNIDTIKRSINLKNGNHSILDNVVDPIKGYLFEAMQGQLRDDIPLSLVYNAFWKAGKIPLLLSSENREECKGFILDVILFMKQMGVCKKFLLKTADLNLNHFKGQLNIFSCLEDIKFLINLDEIKIRVSDSFSISLNTINASDPFFFKGVTPNIFFDLSLGKYNLKPGYGRTFKKRDELKIILSDEVKEQLENNLYARTDLLRMNSNSYTDEKLRRIDPCLF